MRKSYHWDIATPIKMDDLAVGYQGQAHSPETARVTASGAKAGPADFTDALLLGADFGRSWDYDWATGCHLSSSLV